MIAQLPWQNYNFFAENKNIFPRNFGGYKKSSTFAGDFEGVAPENGKKMAG
jgi:hypothetical protein